MRPSIGDLIGTLLLGSPGLFLCLQARRLLSGPPEGARDVMLVLGIGKAIFGIAIFAFGLLFFAAAIWWLFRKKPVTRSLCARCGKPLAG